MRPPIPRMPMWAQALIPTALSCALLCMHFNPAAQSRRYWQNAGTIELWFRLAALNLIATALMLVYATRMYALGKGLPRWYWCAVVFNVCATMFAQMISLGG